MWNRRFEKGTVEAELQQVYTTRLSEIKALEKAGQADDCLQKIADLWLFMNRFRNCDFQFYFDPEIHETIRRLNPKRFETKHLLVPKKEYRICFLFDAFWELGGPSFPHKYILEKYPSSPDVQFKQYVLATNIRGVTDHSSSHRYQYLKESIELEEFDSLGAGLSWIERGKQMEKWIHDRQIDFVVANPDPPVLYALASRPAPFQAVLTTDCYSYTVGPDFTEYSFLVMGENVFNYQFEGAAPEKKFKIVRLPEPPVEYIEKSEPLLRENYGIPGSAVVSATTNLWKCCFGDSEALLEGVASLVRKFPNYHHLFAGTPRCLDNVEFFLNKNPDVKGNIHFIGGVSNIYSLLKMVDFYVNSFPTTGASDLEAAMVGKPSIDFMLNRNLDLHPVDFMRSRECEVTSLDEFVSLGSRYITDSAYRTDLGRYLKGKISREFDKSAILKEKVYDFFVDEFQKKLQGNTGQKSVQLDQTIEYEKRLAFFSAHGRVHWPAERKKTWLTECLEQFPEKPFAWIKALEETISSRDQAWFQNLAASLPHEVRKDHRIQVMLAFAQNEFGNLRDALTHAEKAAELAIYDQVPLRVLARFLEKAGKLEDAARVLGRLLKKDVPSREVGSALAALPPDRLPLYYNY